MEPAGRAWLSGAVVGVVVADDVILAEVVAELDFDHFHLGAAEILQPVTIAELACRSTVRGSSS